MQGIYFFYPRIKISFNWLLFPIFEASKFQYKIQSIRFRPKNLFSGKHVHWKKKWFSNHFEAVCSNWRQSTWAMTERAQDSHTSSKEICIPSAQSCLWAKREFHAGALSRRSEKPIGAAAKTRRPLARHLGITKVGSLLLLLVTTIAPTTGWN